MIESLSGPAALPLAFAAILAVVLLSALARDRVRRRRLEAVGARMGFAYVGRAEGVAAALAELPSMDRAHRHLFLHVLRAGDELIADWVVVVRPKTRRRRRRARTLYATRTAGQAAPPTRAEGADTRPGGIGRYAIERAGEWTACIALDRRLAPEALPAFREQALDWIRALDEGADGPASSAAR